VDGDAVAREGPQLLDEPILVFLIPFTSKRRLGFLPVGSEFDVVIPAGSGRVTQGDLCCIARVLDVLGQSNRCDGGFAGEGKGGRITVVAFVI
jgi:hypothetical protein